MTICLILIQILIMKMNKLFILGLLVFIFSCASPHKNFEKGNFDKAYLGMVKEFEKGNINRKDRNILNKSFSEMFGQNITDSEINLRSDDPRDWEKVYHDSEDLIFNYLKGKRWLDIEFAQTIDKLDIEQDSLRMDIAMAYRQYGNDFMLEYDLRGDKRIAQDAHRNYVKMAEYSNEDDDIIQLLDESLAAATLNILVQADAWDYQYRWRIDNKFQRIENESKNYRQVYFEDIIDQIDCLVRLDFNALDIDDSKSTTTDNYSKDIVDRYETVVDSSGTKTQKPIYRTVKASVRCVTKTKTYRWQARTLIDFMDNYCDYKPSNFSTNFIIDAKSYSHSGDERALPDNVKDLKDEAFAIKEKDIIEDMIDDIFDQFRNRYF